MLNLNALKSSDINTLAEFVKTNFKSLSREIVEGIVARLVELGALFMVNHSGGKDSQALRIVIERLVPRAQIVVVHADLEGAEWDGTYEHVLYDCEGLTVIKTRSMKTLEEMVLWRGMFPTPAVRQCTSDLKRGPIEKAGRHFLVGCPCCETNSSLECNIRTKRDLRFNGIVVNCMGIRAGESAKRAKNNPLKFNASNSKAGRTWFDYLPILDFNCHTDNGFKAGMKDEVIDTILSDGKELHPAYGFDAETRTCTKMKRLSCMFCIMASKTDLALSAKANPEPYARMIATEKVIGHTFAPSANKDGSRSGLEEHIGLPGNKKLIELWVAKLAPQHAVLTEMRESGEKLSAALLVARAL